MRTLHIGLLALICFAVSANVQATNARPSRAHAFLQEASLVQLPEVVAEWDKSLRETLKETHDPARVARTLAPRYGLSVPVVTQLMELWFESTILSWKDYPTSIEERKRQSLDRRYIAVAKAAHHDSRVLAIAAEAINYISRCNPDTYRALIDGARDPAAAGWLVSQMGYCTTWLAAFSELHPDKAAAVKVRLALDEELSRPQSLALTEYLSGDYLRAHATATDYQTLRDLFADRHVHELFDVGFVQQGLDFFDTRSDETRRTLTEAHSVKAIAVTVDGLLIEDKAQFRDVSTDLAVARYVLNKSLKSPEVAISASVLEASRSLLHCWHNYPPENGSGQECSSKDSLGKAALADLALLTPDEDPYDFVEYYYSQNFGASAPSDGSGLWTAVLCKRLAGGGYASICEKARQLLDPWSSREFRDEDAQADVIAAQKTFASIAGIELAKRATTIHQELTDAFGPPPNSEHPADRGNSIEPLPSPFIELPLPEGMRSPRDKGSDSEKPPAWPTTFSSLPSGFSPVRIGRSGNRIAAVSVSQTLDPSGEVSAGGYWIHLSEDGGRTWRDPLYTGLAERFPYVVRAHSKLPIFDGETLKLEVYVEELDTQSITYPPVGLRSKRRAKNLYLQIPIATLRQDSDGDGITDIVEKHLLLDPNNPDSDGDGIPDGEDFMPNVARSQGEDPTHGAMAAVIEKMFHVRMVPIIEGIESATGSDTFLGRFKTMRIGELLSIEHPIFIEGNAADFATLNPSRVVLVYNKAQIAELRRMTPDFHAVSFSPLVVNNDKDRAYLVWSNGWSGGTFRLIREGKGWKVVTLSQWIS